MYGVQAEGPVKPQQSVRTSQLSLSCEKTNKGIRQPSCLTFLHAAVAGLHTHTPPPLVTPTAVHTN